MKTRTKLRLTTTTLLAALLAAVGCNAILGMEEGVLRTGASACVACGRDSCSSEREACDAVDSACTAWVDCAQSCAMEELSSSCLDSCGPTPSALTEAGQVFDCVRRTCADVCSTTSGGDGGASGTGGGAPITGECEPGTTTKCACANGSGDQTCQSFGTWGGCTCPGGIAGYPGTGAVPGTGAYPGTGGYLGSGGYPGTGAYPGAGGAPVQTLCNESCAYSDDGVCQDSEGLPECPYGTDCLDCGPRKPELPGTGGTPAGSCNPAYCPSDTFGSPCCLTPNGPCAIDSGFGCGQGSPGTCNVDACPPPPPSGSTPFPLTTCCAGDVCGYDMGGSGCAPPTCPPGYVCTATPFAVSFCTTSGASFPPPQCVDDVDCAELAVKCNGGYCMRACQTGAAD